MQRKNLCKITKDLRKYCIILKKRGQATYIAPLQPPTLASFQTWGSSEGAGRIRLARHKDTNNLF